MQIDIDPDVETILRSIMEKEGCKDYSEAVRFLFNNNTLLRASLRKRNS